MSDVSTDAFREILSRVPVEDLPPLRRVCKEWRSIIDDPLFVEQLDGGYRFLICKPSRGPIGKLYSIYLSSIKKSRFLTQPIYATNVKNLNRRGVSPLRDMPVPCCHGLILLTHYETERTWFVWNPFTKDFLELPPFDTLTRGHFPYGGIGYDAVSGQYKVVRISGLLDESLETLIYPEKSNSNTWHRIDDYPDCIFNKDLSGIDRTENGVFFNGSLHWFASVEKVRQILALDLGNEKYRLIPAPPASSSEFWRMDASGGCLFVSYSYRDRFDMWVLDDQGGENIWNKFVSLDLGNRLWRRLEVMCYSKSKNEVVIQSIDGLLWYQVEKKSGTEVYIGGVGYGHSCQAIRPSFIRLDGSRNASEITNSKKRKRKSPTDRLALELISRHFDAEEPYDSSWSDSSDSEG